MHQTRHAASPSKSSVVPWLVWGGSVLHVTGRDLPGGRRRGVSLGHRSSPAHPLSSALVLCDPFPAVPSAATNHSRRRRARGVHERRVLQPTTPPSRDAGALSVFIVDRAPVVGVDVKNGWMQGGGRVSVELGTWAPTGMMDCHFGTVIVHGRGVEGAGWQSLRAAAGKAGSGGPKRLRRRTCGSASPQLRLSRGRCSRGCLDSLALPRPRPMGTSVGYLYL